MDQIGIIVLAGGKSSRMGEDKGLMTLFGKPMISYVLDKAEVLSDQIIIVSNNSNYKQFGHQLVKDIYKEKGPLGGIYSGLKRTKYETNLILSCDIPYIKIGLLNYLLYQSDGYDVTVPVHENRIHPLIGVYKTSCLPVIESSIKQGKLKVTNIFDILQTNLIEADEFDTIEFKNLNSKNDIAPL